MDVFAKARELGIDAEFVDGQGQGHRIAHEALDALIAAIPPLPTGRLLSAPVVMRSEQDAAIDPRSNPEIRTAVLRASFESLVGFQLTDEQLRYNVTR